jgi:hypothetical protein
MTEATIRSYAKDLAGTFYDAVRSAESLGEKVQIQRRGRVYMNIDPKAFAKTYPTLKDYMRGVKHGRTERKLGGTVIHIDDGSQTMDTPGWLFWYDAARKQLTEMLGMAHVSEHMKKAIFKAIIEDREKQLKQEGDGTDRIFSPKITQRTQIGPRE